MLIFNKTTDKIVPNDNDTDNDIDSSYVLWLEGANYA